MMTPKQRMVTAFRHGVPDRVPVSPDISNMIPCRLTGKPFWDIYLYRDPPLQVAYVEAVKYFGFDGFYFTILGGHAVGKARAGPWLYWPDSWKTVEERKEERAIIVRKMVETPLGALYWEKLYRIDDPPCNTHSPIVDREQDFAKVKWLLEEEWQWEKKYHDYRLIGDLCSFGTGTYLPIDWWMSLREGGISQMIFDCMDAPQFMEQVFRFYTEHEIERLKVHLRAKPTPDVVGIQGSASSFSVISPIIFRQYNLLFLKEVTRLCQKAGVPSHLHVCGRSKGIVEMVYQETDLNVMEPLERPPGGDVDLKEAKRRFKDKLVLKGNVNTFQTMFRGTPKEVEEEALRCIEAAASGGGFILATGDQCPRDTPDENIFALIETARKFGKYEGKNKI
ncbi:hypothetical protein B9J77_00385 [candidate division NPL-UPA2 bacterium Unc8]|uniref:Uroporphyrinogen decarboxylase (URO-D) domain-containing protein n=1 Tax=candidate division NPL-UPA2 bacterium Unc8 TaxID=1980939 RepID=A0A399G0B0_UNCN2|nr:hypothetical protein [Bacillota bacterium]MBT9137715.1 hypothetical protein [Bacillota bacterium]RII01030.1 MAG: hypothetical protein B9J77_00385 [candidate division NPL-UPA2 bacterium Unc8]